MVIIKFLRDYYKTFTSIPILNYVCKHTHQQKKCVNEQFVNPEKAWKIAGLPLFDGIHFVSLDGGKHYLVPQQNLWVVFGSGKSPIVWNSAIFATS